MCSGLEKEGVEVVYLPVDKNGFVDLKKLQESLNERTILVSIMYTNNEIGTIQPIAKIAEIIKAFRVERLAFSQKNKSLNANRYTLYPIFHTDAVQAFQFLNCDVDELGVDLMTLSAHKIYGPKGIGLLYNRNLKPNTQNLTPIITGGGQEFRLRSGTENVPAIAGFAKAVELADKNREKETKRISELSDYFWKEIKKIYPKAEINARSARESENADLRADQRNKISEESAFLSNILNIYFPNQNADELLMKLDMAGIAVSSGSACSARASKSSHVLKAIGLPENKIKNSLRFSLGKFTTKKELNDTMKILQI